MNPNTEAYIEQFNKLESALKLKLHRKSGSFSALVNEAAKKDPFIRKYKSLLDSFRELRNVLVHEAGNKIIAVPTDGAVRGITRLTEIYTKPKRLDQLFTGKVVTVEATQSLFEALEEMKEHGYTNLPVYDKGRCVGLVNGRVISKWLLNHYDSSGRVDVSFDRVTIKEVLREVKRLDDMALVSRKLDVMTFIEKISETPSPSGIYLLTESGKMNEKPVGIITEKDLGKIYNQLDMTIE